MNCWKGNLSVGDGSYLDNAGKAVASIGYENITLDTMPAAKSSIKGRYRKLFLEGVEKIYKIKTLERH